MTTRLLSTTAAALLAAVLSASALAGATAKDARALVLRASDFPRGVLALNKEGNRQGYGLTFRYSNAGRRNDLSSGVAVMPSAKAAAGLFREQVSDFSKSAPRLALPKYGDEQRAYLLLGTAELYVRKNTVVWMLLLARTGSTGSNANEIRKDEATAELKKYAAIMKRRVGSG